MSHPFSLLALNSAQSLSAAILADPSTSTALRDSAQSLQQALATLLVEREQHADAIAEARKAYANDVLEIDDNPLLSIADSGVWVSAWVWVATSEMEEDEPVADAAEA